MYGAGFGVVCPSDENTGAGALNEEYCCGFGCNEENVGIAGALNVGSLNKFEKLNAAMILRKHNS